MRTSGVGAVGSVLVVFLVLLPLSAAADPDDLGFFTDTEFQRIFDSASLPGVNASEEAPAITGDSDLDARIRGLAEDRGYRLRGVVTAELSHVDGVALHPDAAEAWVSLRDAALDAGHTLRLISGYRSVQTQRSMFLRDLRGLTDSSIEALLSRMAPPGYSKHHTGHAVDITQHGFRAGEFHRSPAWAWLTADNAFNAKRFGFVPSYPSGGILQGPDPEPWEWTFVGVEALSHRNRGTQVERSPSISLLIEDYAHLVPCCRRWQDQSSPPGPLFGPGQPGVDPR